MLTPKELTEQTAQHLLDINAVQFDFQKPFRWSSGWQSPIYTDCRLTLSYPTVRRFITEGFAQLSRSHFSEADTIAGVATAGIPQASLLADRLGLPMLYVRSKPKEHGKENLIEGRITAGARVIVVEDVLSTGNSSLQAVRALRQAGAEVLGVLAIMNYGFEVAHTQFEAAQISYHSLTDYTQLLVEYAKREDVSEKTMASLHEWRKHPEKWTGI